MATLTQDAALRLIKQNLVIVGNERDILIRDCWQNAVNYLNTGELPAELEPLIRAKVKGVMDYEAEFGEGQVLDISSQTEGKCSWTYNVSPESCRDTVYGFSPKDFAQLNNYRRLRW